MFDIGWSEMAIILLIALIVIGPRDLPRVARTMGRWVAKGRGMAREFQTALEDMARETELDKVKSEIEKASRTNIGKTIEKTIDPTGSLGKAFDPSATDPGDAAAKSAPEAAKAKSLPATPAAEKAAAEPAAASAKTEVPPTGPAAQAAKAEAPPAGSAEKTAAERATAPAEAG